ncbi:hypothetical protein O71_18291 [Pontibacter sp. BAB1700]|nr:hypothetical protein O71_18291 [Pontibacter sp. BAB1700]
MLRLILKDIFSRQKHLKQRAAIRKHLQSFLDNGLESWAFTHNENPALYSALQLCMPDGTYFLYIINSKVEQELKGITKNDHNSPDMLRGWMRKDKLTLLGF